MSADMMSRSSIYAFAECTCGGVFQSQSPVDWDALETWTRLRHSQSGHHVTNLVPARLVAKWERAKMRRAASPNTQEAEA